MNITSTKIIKNIKGYSEKIKNEIFIIYLFPLISSLVYYIYILVNVNVKNDSFSLEITNIKFISFLMTILGIYGFACFQCKPFFIKLSTVFCSIIWWFLNFPITNNYINSTDQQNPDWNLLISLQIVYLILIIGLFFLLRFISKSQFSNRFLDVIKQTSHKQKIFLSFLFIIIIVFLFLILSIPSAFQITLVFMEVIFGALFTILNKNLLSPKTVDFTELSLKAEEISRDEYQVTFNFFNNNININDYYKVIISKINIEFTALKKTKSYILDEDNIIENKIKNNKFVFKIYGKISSDDYNSFLKNSYYASKGPKIKLTFDYRVVHERLDGHFFDKLNNNYQRTQESVFINTENSHKYILQ